MKRILLGLAFVLASLGPAQAICNAKFLNPITEVCWDCIFPISVGGLSVSLTGRPDTPNPFFPICLCPGLPPRPGLAIGLWEPARLVDVANEGGCFANLGFDFDFGLFSRGTGSETNMDGGTTGSKWQAHYYYFPLLSILGTGLDALCLETTAFDVAYISEIDPLWQSAELNMLLNPESILFANPIAQAACAAECVRTSTGGLAMDELFWCDGCNGSIYPMQGNVSSTHGGVQSSGTVAAKLQARMHRFLLAMDTSNPSRLCAPQIAPIIKKSQYRWQLTRPLAKSQGAFACGTTGFSTDFIASGKEYPFKGESFGWLMWRKRNCCAL